MAKIDVTPEDRAYIDCIESYRQEADQARQSRIERNRANSDCYHLKQSWSHKIEGQSREFLAKQQGATDQLSSFLKQGIVDLDDWYDVDALPGVNNPVITDEMIKQLLGFQLGKADFYTTLEECLKLGLLNSLMIAKVHGCYVPKPIYIAETQHDKRGKPERVLKLKKDLVWQLRIESILFEDLYIDPTTRKLYLIHEYELDWFDARAMCRTKDNPRGVFDLQVVNALKGKDGRDLIKEGERARVTGQNIDSGLRRNKLKIRECWGTLLDKKGEVIMENCVSAVANDSWPIRRPERNPFWHQQVPFVIAPLARVAKSSLHRAVMDAGTMHNHALNEIYNLNLDNAMAAAYGVRQVREDWMEDASEIADGVTPGMTLRANAQCPPGQKVLERVDTASMSPESLTMYQLTNAEMQSSMLTSDIRQGNVVKDTSATQVVEASQSITNQLSGMAKNIENDFVRPILALSWMTICQHYADFNSADTRKILGDTAAQALGKLSPADRFAGTVNGTTFRVFGISQTLNKLKDFRRLTSLIQTVFTNQILVESFVNKYDPTKFLDAIMTSLDIDTAKIENDQAQQAKEAMQRLIIAADGQNPVAAAASALAGSGGAPNVASQIAQPGSARSGEGQGGPAPGVPSSQFPPSRALQAAGPGSGNNPGGAS